MAKPMITLAKKKHKQQRDKFFNRYMNSFIIWFGRRYYSLENWVNIKVMKQVNYKSRTAKQINQNLALEKGIEGLYEILFYSIVIGLPLYEMHKSTVAAKLKEQKFAQQVGKIQKNLKQVSDLVNNLKRLQSDKQATFEKIAFCEDPIKQYLFKNLTKQPAKEVI